MLCHYHRTVWSSLRNGTKACQHLLWWYHNDGSLLGQVEGTKSMDNDKRPWTMTDHRGQEHHYLVLDGALAFSFTRKNGKTTLLDVRQRPCIILYSGSTCVPTVSATVTKSVTGSYAIWYAWCGAISPIHDIGHRSCLRRAIENPTRAYYSSR